MKIRDLLDEKGYEVVTVPPSFPLADVMRLLVQHNIGSVVVAEEKVVRGILTERDILRLAAIDPATLTNRTVGDVMTTNLVVGLLDDSVDYVMEIMTRNRIRHLPILDDGWLQGILSIGDVVNGLRKKVEAENRYMRDYIRGEYF
jgi:CBS domain-containing protein